MQQKVLPLLCFLTIFFCAVGSVAGQPMGPPNGNPGCWPPPCTIPLDGGISLLIAAGVALGGKKLNDFRKKS